MHGRSWALVGIGITWIWVMLVAGAGEVAAQGKIVIYAAEDEKTTNALTTQFTDETKIGEGRAQGRHLHRRVGGVP